MTQIRDIVAYDVPIILKLSEILVEFEKYGDITRIALDEKSRKTRNSMNVFISFAESAGALRALDASFIVINGNKIQVDRSKLTGQRKRKTDHSSSVFNRICKFRKSRDPSPDNDTSGKSPNSTSVKSRITAKI
jgi:hypothetical protein